MHSVPMTLSIETAPGSAAHLAGVDAPGQVPGTQHGVGDQLLAQGVLTGALGQQGHLGLHHHISRGAVWRERHRGDVDTDTGNRMLIKGQGG